MDAERARTFLLSLPFVHETVQWGDNLVFWAGDKALGGKMFCLLNLDGGGPVASFSAGAELFGELVEREGLRPAPYFARLHWVAAERWGALPHREWQEFLRHACEITFAKMPARRRLLLQGEAQPATERKPRAPAKRSARRSSD